jgi:acetoin utilization deacetylase AcuC-like enzyme
MLCTTNVDINFKHYDTNDDFYQTLWKCRVINCDEAFEVYLLLISAGGGEF